MFDKLEQTSRRELLAMIGKVAGATTMYQAMTSLGFASQSDFKQAVNLSGAPANTSIVILGAGLGGLTAAYELRKAGYQVKVLEFQNRGGGRSITIRGGDRYREINGDEVRCDFDEGNYLNPGPWRLPSHHYALFHYCREFGVEMEAFVQENHNAYLHHSDYFKGVPQRLGDVVSDVRGHVSELLAKSVNQGGLDDAVSQEDKEKLLEGLRGWGVLDENFRYVASPELGVFRGNSILPGGGLMPRERSSKPMALHDILKADLWSHINGNLISYKHHPTMLQPKGGMGKIGDAFTRECHDMIEFNAKVVKIDQNENGVSIYYVDTQNPEAGVKKLEADWCVCNIPLSVLSQIEVKASKGMLKAISAVPYETSFKVGLEFKRRFWEEDEWIYGGITYTNLPIMQIAYPSDNWFKKGSGVLLGAYGFGPTSYKFNTLTPEQRIEAALAYGEQIHPQYRQEFKSGTSWAWHRVPWTLGCYGLWNETTREQYYDTLCQIDNRLILAGEHCSHIPGWQEGAILSGIDAAKRLHHKIKTTV